MGQNFMAIELKLQAGKSEAPVRDVVEVRLGASNHSVLDWRFFRSLALAMCRQTAQLQWRVVFSLTNKIGAVVRG